MSATDYVLHMELSADCSDDIVRQLVPHLSALVRRKVTSAADIANALQEKNWNAIVCSREELNIVPNCFAEQEMKISLQGLREFHSWAETIREEERVRIAREIHDEIGALLTALKFDLTWVSRCLPQGGNELHVKIKTMLDLLDAAGSSANNLVSNLRPDFLDSLGFVAALEIEAQEFSRRTGIPHRIVKPDDDIELSGERSIALLRVFQETLNNITKHAAAGQVQIEILDDGKCVSLIVLDDGKGFDVSAHKKSPSFGLRGIQERIANLGGHVTITSKPGKGTKIFVCVPLR